MEARIVLITHPEKGAREFARLLVSRRLAACCNLSAVTSVYRWEGALEEEPEVLLTVKTTRACLAELEALLGEQHPYDVPEFVAIEPLHVSAGYLAWLTGETGEADATGRGRV